MRRKPPIRHKVRDHTREGKPVKNYQRGKGTKPRDHCRRRVVGEWMVVAEDGMSLNLTQEEKEDYSHLVNDAARRIYVYIRTEWALDHEQALDHLSEYALWGEIPGVTSPLGRGEPVDDELRALFGLPPLAGVMRVEEQEHQPPATPYGFSSYATREDAERYLTRIEENLPQYKGHLKIVRSPQKGLALPWMIKDIYEYT